MCIHTLFWAFVTKCIDLYTIYCHSYNYTIRWEIDFKNNPILLKNWRSFPVVLHLLFLLKMECFAVILFCFLRMVFENLHQKFWKKIYHIIRYLSLWPGMYMIYFSLYSISNFQKWCHIALIFEKYKTTIIKPLWIRYEIHTCRKQKLWNSLLFFSFDSSYLLCIF